VVFLKDGQKKPHKTLGYDRNQTVFYFLFGLGQTYWEGGRRGVGSNIESYGENSNFIVIDYNLKTVNDVDMRSSETN
jgi:hypothetical protein